MNLKSTIVLSAAASLFASASAFADFDARPYVSNNQIFSGGHDDENNLDVAVQRVFTYDFGDLPADPYNIGDPGFNTNGASSFSPASSLQFRGLNLPGGASLQYWNGNGVPNFTSAPAGVSISLSGSPTRAVSFSPTSIAYAGGAPLTIGNFSTTNGALHLHLGSSIFKNGSQAGDSVPTGEYLISYRLENPGTSVANSDPLFIVYNNGLTEEQTAAAAAIVTATYVPEPGSIATITVSSFALLRRRRE